MYIVPEGLRKRNAESSDSKYESVDVFRCRLPDCLTSTYITTSSYLVNKTESYMVGYDNPSFHARTRAGELIPMTPWKQFAFRGESSGGGYTVTTTSYSDKWYLEPDIWCKYEDWVVTEDVLAARIPDPYDMYVTDAAAKIYGNSYDALTALAELIEVRSMFVNTGKKFVTLCSEPRLRKSLRRFAALSKNDKAKFLIKDLLAGNWMELRYGWRTLIYDIIDINKTAETWNEQRTRYSERAGTTSVTTEYNDRIHRSGDIDFKISWKDTWEVGIRGSIVADINLPKLAFNPFATAWELVPLSFVVDWFLSVGKSILAMAFLAKQTKYTAAAGYLVKLRRLMEVEPDKLYNSASACTRWQKAESYASIAVRRPCTVPITPHLTLNLNPQKVIDLTSIIVQRIYGG